MYAGPLSPVVGVAVQHETCVPFARAASHYSFTLL